MRCFWSLNMSTQIEDLYQELQEELADWDRLSDEALESFDKELTKRGF